MRTVQVVVVLVGLLAGCGRSAIPSRWLTESRVATPYTLCECDGVERRATPSEATSRGKGSRVDCVCEGKLGACRFGMEPFVME